MSFRRNAMIALSALLSLSIGTSAAVAASDVVLYEGDYCNEARLAYYDSNNNYTDLCKKNGAKCKGNNDEARSVKFIKSGRAPFWMALFDDDRDTVGAHGKEPDASPYGSGFRLSTGHQFRNDAMIITVDPQRITGDSYCLSIRRAEIFSLNTDGLITRYDHTDGLAGKVSRIEIGH